ncbi:transcriptional regulator [Paraburkholderia sp. BR10936]|uniref:transcriptional regulator n=1 Tax=Paraburkholderia sp. BR10936 TaxID=3236993 RepID=UPI0034D33742
MTATVLESALLKRDMAIMSLTQPPQDDACEPSIAVVLEQLWMDFTDRHGRHSSIARLAKQAHLPMRTLRRTLTRLKSAGLADFSIDEKGRGFATLSAQGVDLCLEIAQISADADS